MNLRLILFLAIYYLTNLIFYLQGKSNPSSSLGYGFYAVGFWMISLVVLGLLIARGKIVITNIWDRVGVVLATPVLFLGVIWVGLAFTDKVDSEWHPYKDGYRYKIVSYSDRSTGLRTRTEIYRSDRRVLESSPTADVKWLKDSTWVYYSKTGDTIKVERYSNDNRVE